MMQNSISDPIVPKRAFGNTGVKISKLCLGGGSFGSADSHALLDEALRLGVDCWEIVSFTGKVYSEYLKKIQEYERKFFCLEKSIQRIPLLCRSS